jgi:hypothetical protein
MRRQRLPQKSVDDIAKSGASVVDDAAKVAKTGGTVIDDATKVAASGLDDAPKAGLAKSAGKLIGRLRGPAIELGVRLATGEDLGKAATERPEVLWAA